jgi:cytochrome c
MFTLMLSDKVDVAYDATNCGLYKVWHGGVKFDGAVYTTVHGPQPTSEGAAYAAGDVDHPVWHVTRDGQELPIKVVWKGYRLQNNRATLHYRLDLPNKQAIWIDESPEAVTAENGQPGLERRFNIIKSVPGVQIGFRPPQSSQGVRLMTNGAESSTSGVYPIAPKGETTVRYTFVIEDVVKSHGPALEPTEEPVAQTSEEGPREPGVAVRVYDVGEPLSMIPELIANQTPNKSFVAKNIDWSTPADFGGLEDYFLVHVTGFLNIKVPGKYVFRLSSDDGSIFSIRDTDVVKADGLHGAEESKTGDFDMAVGEHPFRIEYFENEVDQVLKLEWKVPGTNNFVVVPPSAFTTPEGEVRVTSPGKKRVITAGSHVRPGDRSPVAGVHPSYTLTTVHPDDFKPRIGGIDFLSDGRMVVCNWEPDGGVYILSGVTGDKPGKITVKRFAAGLAEPLGVKVVKDTIYVLQKQELTKLVDTDGDGLADEYESVANGWGVTANFHEFAFGLAYKNGKFYANLATAINPGGRSTQPQNPDRGKVLEMSPNGDIHFVAKGLRTPNGIGIGYKGRIFLCDNQGDWLPSSKLLEVKEGAFYGSHSVDPIGTKGLTETPPVLWMPQNEIGNSPSQPSYLNDGPYKGQMIHGDVTNGGVKRDFIEEVEGQLQGAVIDFTQGLEGGVNRICWGPDGALYIGGIGSTGNWGQDGKLRYGLQKIKYNGKTTFEMLAVRAKTNGFEVELTEPLAKGQGDTAEYYFASQWRYVPTDEYGGPKVDEEELTIKSVTVSKDRKRVFLELPGIKEGRVFYVRLDPALASKNGDGLWATQAWYTLNRIPKNRIVTPAPTVSTLAETGFTALDASHWTGFRKDGVPKSWKLGDDQFTLGRGAEGGDLRTKELYGDFELRLDWKITRGGNSGIIYRSTEAGSYPWETGPEYQVLDNTRHADGQNPITSAGSAYAVYPPTADFTREVGKWNTARIVVKNNHVQHWLNQHLVVEYDLGSADWKAKVKASKFGGMPLYGTPAQGFIVLQDHGDPVSYRNIRIKRL